MYQINTSTVKEPHSCILEVVHISTLTKKTALITTNTGSIEEIQDAIILNLGLGWSFGLPTTGT